MQAIKALVVFFYLILLSAWPGVVWGHTLPVHSEPGVGTTINSSPAFVRIWFDSPLEPDFSTIRVHNVGGEQVDKRNGHVSSSDASLLEVSLPTLPPGTYLVIWSVVTCDGHPTEGDYTFTIK